MLGDLVGQVVNPAGLRRLAILAIGALDTILPHRAN
jgi:hypothetical protein